MSSLFDDITPESGVAARSRGDGNVGIAAALYDAGGGTVASLTEDWNLNAEEARVLMVAVKDGWTKGRWRDRRVYDGPERRQP